MDDFDEYAHDYRAIHTRNIKLTGATSDYYAEHKVLEIKKYEKNSHQFVLDIGCGDGLTEVYFSKHFSSWNLAGIDISAQSIGEAKKKGIRNTNFTFYDGINIPFPNNTFDLVFLSSVLHHVSFDEHLPLLKEIRRVLQPGGRLYLFEHNPFNPATKYIVKTCMFDKNAKLLRPRYAQAQLIKAGFSDIRCKFILFFPRTRLFSKLIKIESKLWWVPLGGQYMYKCVK